MLAVHISMKKYGVIACPNCEFVSVVQLKHKTKKCGRCGKQRKMKKLKKFTTTDSMEKARIVASEVRAKQSGNEEDFKRAFDAGEFDESQYTGIKTPESWVPEDETEVDAEKEVRDVIDLVDIPTRENIVMIAEKRGVTPEETEEIISRLRRNHELMRSSDGEFRLI